MPQLPIRGGIPRRPSARTKPWTEIATMSPLEAASMDDVLTQLGGFGRCQFMVAAFTFVMWSAHAMQCMSMVFESHAQQAECHGAWTTAATRE